MKHGRLAHIRSQFSLFRRSPTHKNLPLATFCTSEQLLFGSFCRSKKNKLVPFREISRFCKPRISAPQRRFRAGRFAAFAGASRRRPLPVHTKRVCRLLCKHSQAAKPPYLLRATRLFAKDFRFTVCRQLSKKNLFAYAVKTKPLTHSAPNLRLSHKGILRQKGNVL